MTTTTRRRTTTGAAAARSDDGLRRTARTAGAFYLCFFLFGTIGTVWVHGRLLGDAPGTTLSHLREQEPVARVGIALEVAVAAVYVLTALWLRRLLRPVDEFASAAMVAFALVGSTAVLGSAAVLATALEVAGDSGLAAPGGSASTVQLLYTASGHLWGVAAVFFGLWLVPMGALVLRSGWFPAPLGWVLVVGGAGYLVSAFTTYLLPDLPLLSRLLVLPSVVGEVWMALHLGVVGVRTRPAHDSPA